MKRATGATAYVPRVIVDASLPAAVDLRASGLTGPIKAQEQVGACTAFAVSSVLDNAIRRGGGNEVASPLHIFATYSEAQDLGQVRGRNMTNEPTWPYNPPVACRFATGYLASDCGYYYGVTPGTWRQDPGLVAQRANADNTGHIPIVELEEITAPLDLVQLAGLIADGEAVWASLAFERGAWDSLANGGGVYLPPQINASEGHAVAVVGYRPGPYGREFVLQNSWGTSWGDRGYAYITERDLVDAWNYGYRIRTTGSPGPVRPGGVSPATCPNGRAPWMGVCLPDSLPGLPSIGTTPVGSCPPGSLPDPFSGGCVALPLPR